MVIALPLSAGTKSGDFQLPPNFRALHTEYPKAKRIFDGVLEKNKRRENFKASRF